VLVTFFVEEKPHYLNNAPCLWKDVGDNIGVIYQTTHPDRAAVDNRLFWIFRNCWRVACNYCLCFIQED